MADLLSRLRVAARSLRWQVSVALLVAAAVCALLAGRLSSEELSGSYRDGADRLLAAAGRHFEGDPRATGLRDRAGLEQRLRSLLEIYPNLRWAGIHRAEDGRVRSIAAAADRGSRFTSDPRASRAALSGNVLRYDHQVAGRHTAVYVRPIRAGGGEALALELGYDLSPFDAAVLRRDTRMFIALAILLSGFTAFTAIVLARGIFRPLDKLRLATRRISEGELRTQLSWKRRDELGALARDFDRMAAVLEESHGRLESLAHSDPLTGLLNHRRFQEELAAEVERARAEGGTLALIVLDVDEFKRINDAHGHPVGDKVIAGAGHGLAAALGGLGKAARLGGDEFGILVADADEVRAKTLCEAARAAVRAAAPEPLKVTCSAGIALFPADASDPASLSQLADGALYWAKQAGRDCSRRYDPEHVLVVTDEQRAQFSELLENPDAVRPVFQPIVSLRTGEVMAYEALARFEDQHRRPPSWWFAQAHRFGLGARLEAEAIRAALAVEGRPPGVSLSVNVSPSALRSPEVLAALPDDLDGVILEITEHEQVLDPAALQTALAPLRERGACVAVDDAGEGYAGLQQVMRMRADFIKLDRSLIADLHVDRAKMALVGALVSFAASTGAELCAEGVEQAEELRVLAALGVTYAQGYALARPGVPWPQVDAEAARVCRSAGSEAVPRLRVVRDQLG